VELNFSNSFFEKIFSSIRFDGGPDFEDDLIKACQKAGLRN